MRRSTIFLVLPVLIFFGCQSNDDRTPAEPDPVGFDIVEQRLATTDEINRLDAVDIAVTPTIGTPMMELTRVLVASNDMGELLTAFVTPLVMAEDELTARIAVENNGRLAAVVARIHGSVIDGVFAPESLELLDVSGSNGVLYTRDSAGLPKALPSTSASSWFDCFLQCVDQRVATNWWLNVVCGPGSPVTTYWCLWIQGGAGWAIISWCIGAASGYCP